jgi:hypothetical protein
MAVTFNPFTGNLDFVGSGGGSTSPGGSDTQIQFNDDGDFGGDAGLVFNKSTNKLTAGGDIELNDGGTYTTTLQTVTPTAARTISFPDATGTVGLVAGSTSQFVYNNAGAYAGVSTLTTDGTNVTLTGRFISSLNGAASAPPGTFTGTWFTGGTATTTKPQVLIEPTGATSTAWSTSGTGLGVNAASGFGGNLLDLQVNGTSIISSSPTTGSSLLRLNAQASAAGNAFRTIHQIGNTATGITTTANGAPHVIFCQGLNADGSVPAIAINSEDFGANGGQQIEINRLKASGAVAAGDRIGRIIFGGDDGTNIINGFNLTATVDGSVSTNIVPTRLAFVSGSTERLRITNEGVIAYHQPTTTAVNSTATLTVANLKTGIITSTSAAATDMTLPTGTNTEGGFSGIYTNMTFEWSVINTGPSLVTVLAATDHTLTGSGAVATGTSARFASRRTAANTFVTYRLS